MRPVELLFGILKCFPTPLRVPFKLRYCSIFKVLCAARLPVDSLFTLPHLMAPCQDLFLWFCKKTFRGLRPSGLQRGVQICIIAILFLVVNGFLKKFFGFCPILAPARPKADRSGPPRPQAGPFQCYIIHYNGGRSWARRRPAAAGRGKNFPSFFKKGFSFGNDCGMIIYTFGRHGCPLCSWAA